MSATLSLYSLTLAHGDAVANNNPALKFVEWKRQIAGIPVENPKTDPHKIPAGQELLIFDGSRSTSIDGTSAFDLSLSPLSPSRYRITHSGGTNPVFRTDRGVAVNGVELTLVANANGTLSVTATTGTPFSTLQPGDEVFIPGLMTGDPSSPFNVMNQGKWQVLGTGGSGASCTLVRPASQDFVGVNEITTPSANSQFLAFTAAGIQVGDKMDLSAGFSYATLRTFEVTEVTSKWVEFTSTAPLAAQVGVTPGATGMKFYTNGKRFLRIESDQECVVRVNGDTGSTQRLGPWTAGDPALVAEYVKVGPTWALKILNLSTTTANVTVISAE